MSERLDGEVEGGGSEYRPQVIGKLPLVHRTLGDKFDIDRHVRVEPVYVGGLRQRGACAGDQVVREACSRCGNEGCDVSHWRTLR